MLKVIVLFSYNITNIEEDFMNKKIFNKLYLHLLLYYNEDNKTYTYSSLAKEIGWNRQTVSKYFKELEKEGIIEKKGSYISVKNIYNLNLEKLKQLYESNLTDKKIIETLDKSLHPKSAIEYYNEDVPVLKPYNEMFDKYGTINYIIYAIIQEHRIVYIGSTENIKTRIQQHCQKRKFLTSKDFIILEEGLGSRYQREKYYIRLFNPEWNIALKE